MSDLVSILIPVYNREKYIGKCIESALAQTYDNIEIIVCDNCSTDATWNICCQYSLKNAKVKIYRNEQNLGPVKNWQICMNRASGRYARIVFSDDLIASDCIEKSVNCLQDSDVGFAFSSAVIGLEEWKGQVYYKYSDNPIEVVDSHKYLREMIFGGPHLPVSPGCAIFRLADLKEALLLDLATNKFPDFNNHGAGPDMLILLAVGNKYSKIAYVDEPLVFFRIHSQSITIADTDGKLEKYYNRARLIFLLRDGSQSDIRFFYFLLWRNEIKKKQKYISLSRVLATYDCYEFSLFETILAVLIKRPTWLLKMLNYKFFKYRR